jgi:hypothetical protein
MKKFIVLLIMGLFMFTIVACNNDDVDDPDNGDHEEDELNLVLAAEFENLIADRNVYLTTIGQSADLDTVWNLLQNIFDNDLAALEAVVSKVDLLGAETPEEGSLVLIVPGASSKGMGAAGTNQTQEENRANAFTARAVSKEIDIVIVHTGGMQRRGVESDPLITASSTSAMLMMIVNAGNTDRYFNNLSNTHDVPLYLYSGAANLIAPLRQLFNK